MKERQWPSRQHCLLQVQMEVSFVSRHINVSKLHLCVSYFALNVFLLVLNGTCLRRCSSLREGDMLKHISSFSSNGDLRVLGMLLYKVVEIEILENFPLAGRNQ